MGIEHFSERGFGEAYDGMHEFVTACVTVSNSSKHGDLFWYLIVKQPKPTTPEEGRKPTLCATPCRYKRSRSSSSP